MKHLSTILSNHLPQWTGAATTPRECFGRFFLPNELRADVAVRRYLDAIFTETDRYETRGGLWLWGRSREFDRVDLRDLADGRARVTVYTLAVARDEEGYLYLGFSRDGDPFTEKEAA